ncbi:hypothetical protein GC173_07005 [bacterium]|nr:hypothetical protein [bacterium]
MRRRATQLAPPFLIAQSVLAALWWLALVLDSRVAAWFLPSQYPPDVIYALAIPDAVLFIGAGFLAAWGIAGRARWAWPILMLHAGASCYATLWCLGVVCLTGEGTLSLFAMTPATAMACAFTWLLRPAPRLYSFQEVRGITSHSSSRLTDVALTLAQIVVVWTVFLGILPYVAWRTETTLGLEEWRFPAWARIVGAVFGLPVAVMNLWLGLTTSWRGRGTPLPFAAMRRLVTTGAYAYVRNPMMVTSVATGVLLSVACGSPLMLGVFLLGGVFWNVVLRPWEERDLDARFGAEYRHYRQHVQCWVPRSRPYRPRKSMSGKRSALAERSQL